MFKRLAAFLLAIMYAFGISYIKPAYAEDITPIPTEIVETIKEDTSTSFPIEIEPSPTIEVIEEIPTPQVFEDVISLTEELVEFDDEDYGHIEPDLLNRRVYIDMVQTPLHYGEEALLVAVLVDFAPTDNIMFIWYRSTDGGDSWEHIPEATDQIYSFILTKENINYLYQVTVMLTN